MNHSRNPLASAPEQLRARLERLGVPGDFGDGARAQFGYDASHFRIAPLGVAYPRNTADVIALVTICRELAVPVIPRGGGTTMAGNAIGRGLVLDFSRHMNQVLHIDPDARTATVQPGRRQEASRPSARCLASRPGAQPDGRCGPTSPAPASTTLSLS